MTEAIRQMQYPGHDGFTEELLSYLKIQGVDTVEDLEKLKKLWSMFKSLTTEGVVGQFLTLEKGMGQERNEPFVAEGEVTEVTEEEAGKEQQ